MFEVGPAKTRDGSEAIIYAVDMGGDWPIHGAIKLTDNVWSARSWTAEGFNDSEGFQADEDLVKPPAELWITLYHSGAIAAFSSKSAAAAHREGPGVARKSVHFREVI